MQHLIQHVAPLRVLAERHYPKDVNSQERFIHTQLSSIAKRLGSHTPEDHAAEAMAASDEAEMTEDFRPELEDDAAAEIPQPVARAEKPAKKTGGKKKGK